MVSNPAVLADQGLPGAAGATTANRTKQDKPLQGARSSAGTTESKKIEVERVGQLVLVADD
jgi:hypothetical protein